MSVLIAYLVRTGDRRALVLVWAAIAVALIPAAVSGIILSTASAEMQFSATKLIGGLVSLLAAAPLTWLILQLRPATPRSTPPEAPQDERENAPKRASLASLVPYVPLVLLAFLAVAREGVETALFLWNTGDNASAGSARPIAGAVTGLVFAIVLGHLICRAGLRLDRRRFRAWTGAALLIVTAGVVGLGFHDLQEAGVLPGVDAIAAEPHLFLTRFGTAGDWTEAVVQGVLNITPQITWLQLIAWAAYAIPAAYLFLRPAGPAAAAREPAAAS